MILFVPNRSFLCPDSSTKRQILKTLAENFDPYNFEGPVLNRARIYMHKLKLQKDLNWDTKLSKEAMTEWKTISKQVNSSPSLEVPRFVGLRTDSYKLIAFTDASKDIYGTTVFVQYERTNEVNFLLAKNRLVNRALEGKSIPALELLGISLGVETILEIRDELAGPSCLNPIKFTDLKVYSDSYVALSWINSYSVKLDKMNKHSVFTMNRLEKIHKLCEKYPVQFSFVDGICNPADCITRPMSHRLLKQSNYLTGPKFLTDQQLHISRADIIKFTVPKVSTNSHVVNPVEVLIST